MKKLVSNDSEENRKQHYYKFSRKMSSVFKSVSGRM